MKELTPEARTAALEMVNEMQKGRATRYLAPADVPKILLPYQARWHEDLSPIRLCVKSRRIGFSWGALAAESALEAALQPRAGGMDQFYMGYNMAMAAEFIGDCAFFAKAYALAASAIDVSLETVIINDEKQDIITYKIRFASGYVVEALSSAPHNWRSRQGHARIDEAAFHANLAEVVKGALAFKMWGGRVDIVSTEDGEDNTFHGYVKDILAGKLPWSLHTVTFADALRMGFYQRVCLVKSLDWSPEAETAYRDSTYADYPSAEDAAEELDCVPKRGSGGFFTRLLLENCMDDAVPTFRFAQPGEFVLEPNRLQITEDWFKANLAPVIASLPTDRRTAYGQDFGRDGDLSVIWVAQEIRTDVWRVVFAVELRRIPFDCQKLITNAICDNLPLFCKGCFDARGNGQSHAEAAMQRYGANRIECVQITAAWYALWFPRYKQAMERNTIIIPGGAAKEDIIADHRLVALHKGNPTMSDVRIKGSDGYFRHGDSAIAGVMLHAATKADGQPAAGASVHNAPARHRRHGSRLLLPRPGALGLRRPLCFVAFAPLLRLLHILPPMLTLLRRLKKLLCGKPPELPLTRMKKGGVASLAAETAGAI